MPSIVGACVLGLLAAPTVAASPDQSFESFQVTIGAAGQGITINDPAYAFTITVTPLDTTATQDANPWLTGGGEEPAANTDSASGAETLDVPAPGAGSLIAIGLTALAARQRRRARTATT